VKPGDRYALTYVPGVGTELALNGTTLGTVEGADFAAAVFAIWLGPQAIDESLKTQLHTGFRGRLTPAAQTCGLAVAEVAWV
jgi:hypothetical protein